MKTDLSYAYIQLLLVTYIGLHNPLGIYLPLACGGALSQSATAAWQRQFSGTSSGSAVSSCPGFGVKSGINPSRAVDP